MMELDVITVAALEALNLDTDRIPVHPQVLAVMPHRVASSAIGVSVSID